MPRTYFSLFHVLLFFYFLITGLFFAATWYVSAYRWNVAMLFFQKPYISFVLTAVSFLFSIAIFFLFPQKKHIRFQMVPHSVDIDCNVIRSYVHEFWQEEFPKVVKDFDLFILPDNTLEISVKLAMIDLDMRKRFLEKSEYGLGKILSGFLDYHQKFYINIHV